MNEQERSELEMDEQELDIELDLDDIMKEFGAEEEREVRETSAQELLEAALSEAGVRLGGGEEEIPVQSAGDTVAFAPVEVKADPVTSAEAKADTVAFSPVEASTDTVSFPPVEEKAEETEEEE